MWAIDYLPPVEFEFPDFLAALLVSDAEIVPDDKHGYRDTVLRQRTSLSATMDLQPGVTHVELAAPALR
jgi:CO/xanthine dehydrogenase FAD-binding subunit